MPIGSSSGQYFPDEGSLLVDQYGADSPQGGVKLPMTEKQKSDRKEMAANETSGDFQSRFGAIESPAQRIYVSPQRPSGGPTEVTGAFNSSGGTQVAQNTSTQELPDIDDVLAAQENASKPAPNTIISGTNSTTGRKINITDRDLDQAMGLAMAFSGGGMTLAGVKAGTMPSKLADLGHAQVLEANGVHPYDIWQETGFGRGADGKWRHEIDDSKSSFDRWWTQDSNFHIEDSIDKKEVAAVAPLPAILAHPELYKAYPQLKDVNVRYDPELKDVGAYWNKQANEVVMGPGLKDDQGILMHEIQHAIQDYEGFAKGGYTAQADVNYALKYGKYNKQFRDSMFEFQDLFEKSTKEGLTPAEEQRYGHLTDVLTTYNQYAKAANEKAAEYYVRLAGEVEARNVDSRLLLKEGERRAFPPQATEDVDRSMQIPTENVAGTTAYGVKDPITGAIARSEPTQFRRAANDNAPLDPLDHEIKHMDYTLMRIKELQDLLDKTKKK